ncbi:MAG: glycoside hydrolase family 3 N-terminal domain-containing protein [Candidatus Krumholzibacteriaceae bacterium]|jgi:beta-glucosidase-like glycosyl hydrolase
MDRDVLMKMLAPHMIVGLEGPLLTADEKRLLAEYPFAGVILFERNVSDARRLMELTREIRSIFRELRGTVPLIAADHEGGVISVLARAIGVPPTQMAAARTGDRSLCERLFAENARRMRAVGANMLLGPVADVNSEHMNPVIGTRSFGEDTREVSSLVSAAVSAARREGVVTCIKHFPGHGPSSVDSHLALPVLEATLDELRERDIPPFASGIAAGVESVMIGHIAPRGRSLPATLDPGIIGDLLRGELGFEGAAITDALEMEGVKVAGLVDICSRALEAGNDILLFSKPVEAVVAGLEAESESPVWAELAAKGSGGFLKSSLARVERLLQAAAARDREFELPGDPGTYREIAEKSIRAQRASGAASVFDPARGFKLVFYSEKGEFDRFPTMSFVARALKGFVPGGEGGPRLETPLDVSNLEGRVFSLSKEPGAPVDVVFLLNRRPLAEEVVREVCSGASVVVVVGWPYAVDFVAPGPATVVTYGVYDAAAEAVCRILTIPKSD